MPAVYPYCGPAPLPADLLGQWNVDPALLFTMTTLAAVHVISLHRTDALHRKRGWLIAFWLVLIVLFVSPLCALSSALFSVRVAHHMLLIALAAPILVLSLPDRWRALAVFPGVLGLLFALHVGVVWLWHAPAPYSAAMTSDLLFWIMQLSLIISAIAVWLACCHPWRRSATPLPCCSEWSSKWDCSAR